MSHITFDEFWFRLQMFEIQEGSVLLPSSRTILGEEAAVHPKLAAPT